MRKLIPLKNSVVCRRIGNESDLQTVGTIYIKKKNVDIYEIIDFSVDKDVDFDFKIGDKIMACSTGDEIEINPNEVIYLFKIEHVMCKVEL